MGRKRRKPFGKKKNKKQPKKAKAAMKVEVEADTREYCCAAWKCEAKVPKDDLKNFVEEYQKASSKYSFYMEYYTEPHKEKPSRYFIRGRTNIFRVCRKFFEANVGPKPPREKVVPKSQKHIEKIVKHIESFPRVTSIYSSKKFISAGANMTLEKFYKNFIKNNPSDDQPDIFTFQEVLKNRNIHFPDKKDISETFVEPEIQIFRTVAMSSGEQEPDYDDEISTSIIKHEKGCKKSQINGLNF